MTTQTFSIRKFIRKALAAAGAFAMPAALVATGVALVPPSVEAAPDSMTRAVAALRGISTMKADFVQTDRSGQRVSGEMTLKRPGRIRFEYEKGVPMLIVADGSALTLIDYEVNQVQRWPIRNSPLGALLDPARDVARYAKLKPTGHADVISIEVRDPKKPEYGVITMIFVKDAAAPGGLELASWVALDSQNNRTTVRLTNQRYGISVPNSTFRFRDPRKTGRRSP